MASIDAQKNPYAVSNWRSYVILVRNNRQYRRLWLAGVISQLGNWFNYIAIFVLLNTLTGSGQSISWFLIAKFIPTTILGPAAGVIADRFSRKIIMISSDLARVAVVLAFLLVRRPEMAWLVYALAFVQESLWTFADPARRASVPNLCSKEELNVANALAGATWSILLAFGAGLGGLVTALWGWQTAIVLDALTFLVSAMLLAKLLLPPPPQRGKDDGIRRPTPGWQSYTGITDLIEGARYVYRHRQVAALLLVKSGWALSGGILVMLPVFGEQVFQVPGEGSGSGLLYSCRGIGAAVGPLLAWRALGESRAAMYKGIGISFFISAAAYLCFSQAPGLLIALPFVFIGHVGGSIQWVFSTTLLQRMVDDLFRGRVFAAEMALLTLMLSLSTYLTGLALDHGVNPRMVVVWLALCFCVPGMLWNGARRWQIRQMDSER